MLDSNRFVASGSHRQVMKTTFVLKEITEKFPQLRIGITHESINNLFNYKSVIFILYVDSICDRAAEKDEPPPFLFGSKNRRGAIFNLKIESTVSAFQLSLAP